MGTYLSVIVFVLIYSNEIFDRPHENGVDKNWEYLPVFCDNNLILYKYDNIKFMAFVDQSNAEAWMLNLCRNKMEPGYFPLVDTALKPQHIPMFLIFFAKVWVDPWYLETSEQ